MHSELPFYSTLYTISDLHMGGPPGMRMFRQGTRLGGFLHWLATPAASGEQCALVIAGDFMDTLPYMSGTRNYIAVDEAAEIVRSISGDYPEVFAGLKAFVATPNRELILLLGNHDLELALPEAQEALLSILAGSDVAARGRVRFATDGTGFRCRVGDKMVYVTHGNEADRWNHVDYEALRKVAHRRSLGYGFDAANWLPNAGTKLVVEVMNDIKRTRPWVDLLKPENEAMIRLLAIFDSRRLAHALAAMRSFGRLAQEWAAGPRVVLGEAFESDLFSERELEELFAEARGHASTASAIDASGARLLAHVRELHARGVRPEDLVSPGAETLGFFRMGIDRLRGVPEPEAVREALGDWIAGDDTFKLDLVDPQCRDILAQVGSGIDVVIAGHTHLPRRVPSHRPGVVYLNAGTWARLIGIPHALLDESNRTEFGRVYELLRNGSLEQLDAIEFNAGNGRRRLISDVTLAVRISPDGDGSTSAELVRVKGNEQVQVELYGATDLLESA